MSWALNHTYTLGRMNREGRALQENQSYPVIPKKRPHLVLGHDVSPYYACRTGKGDNHMHGMQKLASRLLYFKLRLLPWNSQAPA